MVAGYWSYGMGGALLQQVNRDTLKFALKCSAIDRSGKWHNVYKNPKTDPSKASKGGRFNLIQMAKSSQLSKSTMVNLSQRQRLETVLEDGNCCASNLSPKSARLPASYDSYLNPPEN